MAGLTRKELLAGAAAAGVVAGCGGSPKPDDPRGWAAVKAQFALSRDVRHFDAFVLATHPKTVREAIERHRRGLDADPNGYLQKHEAALDERVQEAGARYLGVNAADLALTDSTTMGLGLVYGSIRSDGEAVATEHDFYATHEALRLRFGTVRKIRLYDDPATVTADGIVEAVQAGIDGNTGLLALTWVHSSTGVKLPLEDIAQRIDGERHSGMLVVVDGVHALGADDGFVGIDSFDVFVTGCHKWLGGPRGTGLIWSIKAWEALRPIIPSFEPKSYIGWLDDRPLPPAEYQGPALTPGGYHSFEHRWALAEAFDYQAELGRAKVAERIRTLATRLKEGLADLPKVRLVTPMSPALSAGIVCFDVDGLDPGQAVEQLRREHRIGASVTPYAERHVRFGTGLWVDEKDVDAAIRAVARL
jgi:selenocysteine lyase/cysteine desulfurase